MQASCGGRELRVIDAALPRTDTSVGAQQTRRMRSSAGEHLVDIEGVTGSIPVTSTILLTSRFHALAAQTLRANGCGPSKPVDRPQAQTVSPVVGVARGLGADLLARMTQRQGCCFDRLGQKALPNNGVAI